MSLGDLETFYVYGEDHANILLVGRVGYTRFVLITRNEYNMILKRQTGLRVGLTSSAVEIIEIAVIL